MSARQIKPRVIDIAPINSTARPGKYSGLVKAILDNFAAHFAPESVLIHARDARHKPIDTKMPDVVLYEAVNNRLFLIDSVSGNGPMDDQRRAELSRLFTSATPGLVYVTAFPTRSIMARYLPNIAWETEVWVADAPSHLIHFNGTRFPGPYSKPVGH